MLIAIIWCAGWKVARTKGNVDDDFLRITFGKGNANLVNLHSGRENPEPSSTRDLEFAISLVRPTSFLLRR